MARRDYGSGSIEPRGKNRWRVEIALAPDRLTGGRRRRRFPVRGTKLEAQRALREAQHERDNGEVDPNRITVAEWLSRWLERRIEDAGPSFTYAARSVGSGTRTSTSRKRGADAHWSYRPRLSRYCVLIA